MKVFLHSVKPHQIAREDARAVLAELVALKNLKEQIKAYNPQFLWTGEEQKVYAAMAEEYDRRKPLAWEAARSVLSGEPAPTMLERIFAKLTISGWRISDWIDLLRKDE